eukprot:TRINITY_DN3476_c0_g6_i1.p1 TRINITY_DN3476_c0_g6~~TRINITY_DN3476_c0_g6_i1.p1  ORF type:complete len:351 (-),score=90.74 TRINITY_DN3476_c0_g6_i1:160-1212(-)
MNQAESELIEKKSNNFMEKYDQSTFWGRACKFIEQIDPWLALVSKKEALKAKEIIESVKDNPSEIDNYSEKEFDRARRIYLNSVHPQTGHLVPKLGRMSSYALINLPISAGMIFSAPIVGNIILWQWVNQSLNAVFNFCNRNTENGKEGDDTKGKRSAIGSEVWKSYFLAASTAVGAGLGFNSLLRFTHNMPPAFSSVMRVMVPFVAVATAGCVNAFTMRRNELVEGIPLEFEDEQTTDLKSKKAAKICMSQVMLSRIVLPFPMLIGPPLVINALKYMKLFPSGNLAKKGLEAFIMGMFVYGALPIAVGLFPQRGAIRLEKLEPRFSDLVKETRCDEDLKNFKLYFNKGL